MEKILSPKFEENTHIHPLGGPVTGSQITLRVIPDENSNDFFPTAKIVAEQDGIVYNTDLIVGWQFWVDAPSKEYNQILFAIQIGINMCKLNKNGRN